MKVKMSPGMMRKLRASSDELLKDFAPIVRAKASETLALAQTSVPRDTGGLAQSAFVDGPERNKSDSVSATTGYTHHAAGAIHENFHYGVHRKPEPHWLKKAGRKFRAKFRKALAAQVPNTLSRVFGR